MSYFKTWPRRLVTPTLADRYFSAVPHRRSFPSRWPLFALDRIWVKPRSLLRRIDTYRSPLTRLASDHLPLVADIDLQAGNAIGSSLGEASGASGARSGPGHEIRRLAC